MKIEYPLRLQSYLSKCGVGSRRFCESLINDYRVMINNNIVTQMGLKVEKDDVVYVDNSLVEPEDRFYYYLLNKPRGYVCTNSDPHCERLARDLINVRGKNSLFNVGRLDKESEGLILFTNDGDLAYKLTHPKMQVEKEYMVRVKEPLDRKALDQARKGVVINGVKYKIKSFKIETKYWVRVVLTEGKNREIRKIFENFNLNVVKLVRIRIASLNIGNLETGKFRELTKGEIKDLLEI